MESANPEVDTSKFEERYEEADTRMTLHCVQSRTDSVVVQVRDTNILVLLLAVSHRMHYTKQWLTNGTAK